MSKELNYKNIKYKFNKYNIIFNIKNIKQLNTKYINLFFSKK